MWYCKSMMKDGEKTMGRGFELLELVGRSRGGLRGREIAEALGVPVSTAFRQLKFLVERGYLRSGGGVYTLGSTLIRLGNEAMRQNPLSRLAHGVLSEFAEATSETVHLAERRGDRVVYVDKVEGSRSVRMGSMIGNTSPLHCTGVGKAILAFLPEKERRELVEKLELTRFTDRTITERRALVAELDRIRAQGYAVDDCEHEPGVFCVAAPVFDSAGTVPGAISVSGSELYLRGAQEALKERVLAAAAAISAELR